jgi:hypothetical protein
MNENILVYWTVTGPGRNLIANFKREEDALGFRLRVIAARLEQLERIRPVLTDGEYNGEYNFRRNGIAVKKVIVPIMTDREAADIKNEELVDGNFLVIGGRDNHDGG